MKHLGRPKCSDPLRYCGRIDKVERLVDNPFRYFQGNPAPDAQDLG